MIKAIFKITIVLFLVLVAELSMAHEIHMKDGRIIKSKTIWEEDELVNYEKFGTVIGIKKDLVKEIIYVE
jgi:hypothetical protein